ncbi:MAG: ATP-binding cassette domain-containing protein, partial [Spirochaetota bacterium]|nr:ATP-binding cassette domain-containing protein [Spirochaetota bacterium]
FFAELSDVPKRKVNDEVMDVLKKVDLYNQRYLKPGKLSHGMTKRVAIAQALLGDPDIVLLDEPISGLDPKNAYEFKKLIIELGKEKTIVISSHVMADISEMCEVIGIIHDGKMRFEGPLNDLTDVNSKVNYRISKSVNNGLLVNIPEIIEKTFDEKKMILSISFADKEISLENLNKKVFNLLTNENIGIYEITLGKTLEEGFLKMLC